MVSSGVDYETSRRSVDLAGRHLGLVYSTVGVHPWNVKDATDLEVEATERIVEERTTGVVGVGEVGMDSTYSDGRQLACQEMVFRRMLALAERIVLPVVIHSRAAASRILEITASYRLKSTLFHWYSGPLDLLNTIVDRGYYVSEGPPVVYSPRIQEIVKSCPLSMILSETDGPVVYRGLPIGTRTTPLLIPKVVEKIAEIKGVRVDEVAERILENFERMFSISRPVLEKR